MGPGAVIGDGSRSGAGYDVQVPMACIEFAPIRWYAFGADGGYFSSEEPSVRMGVVAGFIRFYWNTATPRPWFFVVRAAYVRGTLDVGGDAPRGYGSSWLDASGATYEAGVGLLFRRESRPYVRLTFGLRYGEYGPFVDTQYHRGVIFLHGFLAVSVDWPVLWHR